VTASAPPDTGASATPARMDASKTEAPAAARFDRRRGFGYSQGMAMATATAMRFDLAIVGAGPVGLALAASLSGCGLRIVILERQGEAALRDPADDGREIALTHRSVSLLQALGAWDLIPPAAVAPLREAQVLNGPSPYTMRLDPADAIPGERRPLGRFVPNRLIRRSLFLVAERDPDVTLLEHATVGDVRFSATGVRLGLTDGRVVEARLAVCADSRLSRTREAAGIAARMEWPGQHMVVCRMRHERPHDGISTAWFDYGRTLSILPLNGNRCSAVLALPSADAKALMALDERAFSERVTRLFGDRLGRMEQDDERHSAEVVTGYAERFVRHRLALAGDAAVGMHPVTAHGFNLGLASQDTLAGLVRQAAESGRDIAAPGLLARYGRTHRAATLLPYRITTAIVHLYGDADPAARLLRNGALRLGNSLPFLRRTILSTIMAD